MDLRAALVIVCLSTLACAPKIDVVRYDTTPRLAARAADCDAPVYEADDSPPESCQQVADVFLGEGGSTTSCDPDELRAHLRKQICLFGGSAAHVVRLTPPAGGSSCHQLRASMLTCDEGDPGGAR